MPSRTVSCHREIRDVIAARERQKLGVVGSKGPSTAAGWQFAWFEA